MTKIKFRRGQKGRKGDWGVGLDYLLKDCWDDLDKLVEDNYYGRHDAKLINFLFQKAVPALKNSVSEMRRLCKDEGKGLDDWIKKERGLQDFSKQSKTLSEKVIFIDSVVQFLRATYWD